MQRNEFVRKLVLNAICDGYENVDQCILPEVAAVGTKCGIDITRSEVVHALTKLVEDGLAKAYRLSTTKPHSTELEGMPPLDEVEEFFETYFFITPEGMEVHMADDWWPLDEHGNLIPGFIPPGS